MNGAYEIDVYNETFGHNERQRRDAGNYNREVQWTFDFNNFLVLLTALTLFVAYVLGILLMLYIWRRHGCQSPLYVLKWPPTDISTSWPYIVTIVLGSHDSKPNSDVDITFTLSGTFASSDQQLIHSSILPKGSWSVLRRSISVDFLVLADENLGDIQFAAVKLITADPLNTCYLRYLTVTDLLRGGKQFYLPMHDWLVASNDGNPHVVVAQPQAGGMQLLLDNMYRGLYELHVWISPLSSTVMADRLDSFFSLSLCHTVLVLLLFASVLTFYAPSLTRYSGFFHLSTITYWTFAMLIITTLSATLQLIMRMIRIGSGQVLTRYSSVGVVLMNPSSYDPPRTSLAAGRIPSIAPDSGQDGVDPQVNSGNYSNNNKNFNNNGDCCIRGIRGSNDKAAVIIPITDICEAEETETQLEDVDLINFHSSDDDRQVDDSENNHDTQPLSEAEIFQADADLKNSLWLCDEVVNSNDQCRFVAADRNISSESEMWYSSGSRNTKLFTGYDDFNTNNNNDNASRRKSSSGSISGNPRQSQSSAKRNSSFGSISKETRMSIPSDSDRRSSSKRGSLDEPVDMSRTSQSEQSRQGASKDEDRQDPMMMNRDSECLAIRDGRLMGLPGFPILSRRTCDGRCLNVYARCNPCIFDSDACCKRTTVCRNRFDSMRDWTPGCPPCEENEDTGNEERNEDTGNEERTEDGKNSAHKLASKTSQKSEEDECCPSKQQDQADSENEACCSANQKANPNCLQPSKTSIQRARSAVQPPARNEIRRNTAYRRSSAYGAKQRSTSDTIQQVNQNANVNMNSVADDDADGSEAPVQQALRQCWNNMWDNIRPAGTADDPHPELRTLTGRIVEAVISSLKSQNIPTPSESVENVSRRKEKDADGSRRHRHRRPSVNEDEVQRSRTTSDNLQSEINALSKELLDRMLHDVGAEFQSDCVGGLEAGTEQAVNEILMSAVQTDELREKLRNIEDRELKRFAERVVEGLYEEMRSRLEQLDDGTLKYLDTHHPEIQNEVIPALADRVFSSVKQLVDDSHCAPRVEDIGEQFVDDVLMQAADRIRSRIEARENDVVPTHSGCRVHPNEPDNTNDSNSRMDKVAREMIKMVISHSDTAIPASATAANNNARTSYTTRGDFSENGHNNNDVLADDNWETQSSRTANKDTKSQNEEDASADRVFVVPSDVDDDDDGGECVESNLMKSVLLLDHLMTRDNSSTKVQQLHRKDEHRTSNENGKVADKRETVVKVEKATETERAATRRRGQQRPSHPSVTESWWMKYQPRVYYPNSIKDFRQRFLGYDYMSNRNRTENDGASGHMSVSSNEAGVPFLNLAGVEYRTHSHDDFYHMPRSTNSKPTLDSSGGRSNYDYRSNRTSKNRFRFSGGKEQNLNNHANGTLTSSAHGYRAVGAAADDVQNTEASKSSQNSPLDAAEANTNNNNNNEEQSFVSIVSPPCDRSKSAAVDSTTDHFKTHWMALLDRICQRKIVPSPYNCLNLRGLSCSGLDSEITLDEQEVDETRSNAELIAGVMAEFYQRTVGGGGDDESNPNREGDNVGNVKNISQWLAHSDAGQWIIREVLVENRRSLEAVEKQLKCGRKIIPHQKIADLGKMLLTNTDELAIENIVQSVSTELEDTVMHRSISTVVGRLMPSELIGNSSNWNNSNESSRFKNSAGGNTNANASTGSENSSGLPPEDYDHYNDIAQQQQQPTFQDVTDHSFYRPPPAPTPPLRIQTLSNLWDAKPYDRPGWRGYLGVCAALLLTAVVVVLMALVGLAYVVLGAQLETDTAWLWLIQALIAAIVHILLVDPLRILLIAFYWTIFRHELLQ